MSEKEFLVDAVAQFLQTSAWQDAINQFFATHLEKFPLDSKESANEKQSKGTGFTLEQYGVFSQFKEMIEILLEGVMGELGCNGEDLVQILEQSMRQGVSGERKFLIKTLLSFEDYEDFHARITEYAALQATNVTSENDAATAEWEFQLALAHSVLDAHAQGLLDETEQHFVPWAQALVGMNFSSNQAVAEGDGDTDEKPRVAEGGEQDERLKELERTLIKERLKVDLLVAQRIAEANAALKKEMLHLTVSSDESDDAKVAEDDLDALFSQVETVRDRLKVVKSKCFEFKTVDQDAMDQIYLFLKEKIHYQQDLVSQDQDIAAFIFSRIPQSDASLVPLLLEWLLLESEGLRVQNQIQEQLGQGAASETSHAATTDGDGFWTQSWDENAQAFFYFHSVTGDSVWEPPAVGFYDANQDYQTLEHSATTTPVDDGDEERVAAASVAQEVAELEDKINESSSHNPTEVCAMESVLDKISREHDEERKRLELVFQVEKARQKEELRRRKDKKRRDKLLKKKKKEERDVLDERPTTETNNGSKNDDTEDRQSPPPLMAALPPIIAQRPSKAESKGDDDHDVLGIQVPGRGRIELAHLLSESHAKHQLSKRGLTLSQVPAPQALLNPTSLRYLAESLAKKNPDGWTGDISPKSSRAIPLDELVLDEAEEK